MPTAELAAKFQIAGAFAAAEMAANAGSGVVAASPVKLMDHLREVDPGRHLGWWHVGAMVEVCQAVLDGEIKRLMLHAPPRYFKSRIVVQGLSSCYVRNNPGQFAALLFASDKLARHHSTFARENVSRAGVELRQDSQDKALWMVSGSHGGMWITTIRGKPLGFGYRLGIVDDPLGSYEEAQLATVQQIAEEAYDSFVERGEKGHPEPALVVMHQRLAARDLAGRLYGREADHHRAEGWTVLELAAEKRSRRISLPATCAVIPDPREVGVALCEELESVERIRTRKDRDSVRAASVDGQEPLQMAGGGIFRASFFKIIGLEFDLMLRYDLTDQRGTVEAMAKAGQISPILRWVRGHDFSAGGDDTTTSALLAVLKPGAGIEFVWCDMTEDSPAAAAVEGKAVSNATRNPTDTSQAIPKEVGTGGVFSASLTGKLRQKGYAVHVMQQHRAKKARALPHAGATAPSCLACSGLIVRASEREAMSGADLCKCDVPIFSGQKVAVLAGPMADKFIAEHHEFTGEEGGQDNLVDAAAMAFNAAQAPRPRGGGTFDPAF